MSACAPEATRTLAGVWTTGRWARWVLLVVAVAALAAVPLIPSTFAVGLLTEVLIFGLFALSLDVLLGYTGLVSFGHAVFFGVGAYSAGLIGSRLEIRNLLIVIPVVILISVVVGLALGFLSLRTSGVAFLMVTLAFAQLGFALVEELRGITGGDDGLTDIPRPRLELLGFSYRFNTTTKYYYLTVAIVVISYLVVRRFLGSPVGHALVGIRENQNRLRALGYDTFRYKLTAFVVSGVFGSLAGMLHAGYNGYVSPEVFYWTTSGTVLIMVIIGGAGTLIGPMLGAALVLLLRNLLSSYVEREGMVTGAVFVFFVLFLPGGIMGLWRMITQRRTRSSGRAGATEAEPIAPVAVEAASPGEKRS